MENQEKKEQKEMGEEEYTDLVPETVDDNEGLPWGVSEEELSEKEFFFDFLDG